MPKFKSQRTKTLHIRQNDRSSDFVTPNFIYGCAGGCRNSYCYVMRYNYENIFVNENDDEILNAIQLHAEKLPFPKTSNQVDPLYWVYDIGCSTDIALHWKHYNWHKVFDFFKHHQTIKATFATKYVNPLLLEYNPQGKIRIRFSLMPQVISTILEPKTSRIEQRIEAIQRFIQSGYEVHINFSPIVVYDNWLTDYAELFECINVALNDEYKSSVKAECIFLTHNEWQHARNLENNRQSIENLIWQPSLQELKTSQYGSEAVRYNTRLKAQFIRQWRQLHGRFIPWNTIRYIF